MFDSPAAYADHLATVIDDEELVLLAVRRKFPKYGYVTIKQPAVQVALPITDAEFSTRGRTKPMSKYDAPMCTEITDRQHTKAMENGSQMLLKALWREHPKIINTLSLIDAAVVVRP